MSESVFRPIINIGPTDVIYEKISFDKTNDAHKYAELFGSDGSEITTKKKDITDGTEFFVVRGNKSQAGKYVKDNFDYDKFFIKNNTYGGRKRKQSKYSSKKRSVKSRRNSRKSRYSRRR
jgi:hypothetical protein